MLCVFHAAWLHFFLQNRVLGILSKIRDWNSVNPNMHEAVVMYTSEMDSYRL